MDRPQGFYLNRFARLLPALVCTILILIVLDVEPVSSSWGWHILYASNIYTALGGEKTVFWTLAVEEQFYLIWPAIVLGVPRHKLSAGCVLLFCVGVLWHVFAIPFGLSQRAETVLLPRAFEAFGVGALLAVLDRCNPAWFERKQLELTGLAAAAAVCAMVVNLVWGRGGLLAFALTPPLLAISLGWVIARAVRGFNGVPGRLLSWNVLCGLGTISYGIYLIHNFMPEILARWINLPRIAFGPLVLVMTILIAAVSYEYMERPIRDAVRRWANS